MFSSSVLKCICTKEPKNGNAEKHPNDFFSLGKLYFVISLLIIFTTDLSKIPWLFLQIWEASGIYFQEKWESYLGLVGEDPVILWVYSPPITTAIIYWTLGSLYTIVDVFNKPLFTRNHKVQPGTNEPVDTKRLLKVFVVILFNQSIVNLPMSYIGYQLLRLRGFPPLRPLPSFSTIIFEICLSILIEDTIFYYSHLLFHNKFFYKHVHKLHHEWTAPIAMSAIYAHPVEHVVSNIFPPFVCIFLLGAHVATAHIWYSILIVLTLNNHCGYHHLPFLPPAAFHDAHHRNFNQCYSFFGILDYINGTQPKIYLVEDATSRGNSKKVPTYN